MISFIIIGKNEEEKLRRTLLSVSNYIQSNNIKDFEIIYVDSSSKVKSVEIALSFGFIKIFKIIGPCNAALGRNIGAIEAKGDYFFFIDGDMEIQASFHSKIIDITGNIKYDLVSGQILNFIYDINFTATREQNLYYPNLSKDRIEDTFGGIFLIKRILWEKYNGMRTEFKFGEDIDFSLRLAKDGVRLLRKKDFIAYHHTSNVNDYSIKSLTKLGALYSRGLLYRKNILNVNIIKRIIKSDPTALLLFTIIMVIIFTKNYNYLSVYLVLVIIISFMLNKSTKKTTNRILYQVLRDLQVIYSFLFFYPRKIKMNYVKINKTEIHY